MHDLKAQIREYIDSVASPVNIAEVQRPPSEHAIAGDGSRRAWFRRWRAVAVAAAGTVLVAGLVSTAWNPGRDVHVEAGRATGATPDPAWPMPFGPEAPQPVVPDGWKVLDFEDLRFAVPGDWVAPDVPSCLRILPGEHVSGAVLLPNDIKGSCTPAGDPLPASVLTIEPAETGLGPGEVVTVGTRSALRIANESCAGCAPVYQFDNGLQVTITGPEADAILATFTDSGARRALQVGPVAETSGWQAVDYEGVQMRVPAHWAIRPPGRFRFCRAIFGGDRPSSVLLGEAARTTCASFSFDDSAREAADGLWIRSIDDASAAALGTPIAQGEAGGVTVTAVRVHASQRPTPQPVLDLLVRAGASTLWVTLGVGSDASIARAILESLRSG